MPVIERKPRLSIEVPEIMRYPFVAYCDEAASCYFVVSAKTLEQGYQSLSLHNCPDGGRNCKAREDTWVEFAWHELDACIDGIMLAKSGDPEMAKRLDYFKGRAHGMASMLYASIGGTDKYLPSFPEFEDITREGLRRYKMRIGEIPWEPTDHDRYNAWTDGPTPNWEEVVRTKAEGYAKWGMKVLPAPSRSAREIAETWEKARGRREEIKRERAAAAEAAKLRAASAPRGRTTTRVRNVARQALATPPPAPLTIPPSVPEPAPVPAAIPGVTLPPDVEAGVRNGLKSGLFTEETLAEMYGIPISLVLALKS